MGLDLRNFININIKYNSTNVSSAARGIVTLITIDRTGYEDDPMREAGPNGDGILYSVADYNAAKPDGNTVLDKWVKSFFNNGGKALQIIGGYDGGDIDTFLLGVLSKLDYRFVIIVSDVDEQVLRRVAGTSSTTNTIDNPITGENTVSTFSGLNEKYFISSTSDLSGKLYDSVKGSVAPAWAANTYYDLDEHGQYVLTTEAPQDWSTTYINYYVVANTDLQNYVIKVGEKGIEMLAAAYLSKVRITDSSTIQDYAFTIENLDEFQESEIDDNNIGVKLVKGNMNFDSRINNAIRNYPGDTIHGDDMMNYYVRILLTQDLTESIMNLLASKIRFNQTGINRLNNAISQEMNTYISNGYLNTEYIWTEDDLYYEYNGQRYLICSRNTPLVKGYKCIILPLTSLTPAQRESHVLPPVYLLLADQTGIRMVVISGDVY